MSLIGSHTLNPTTDPAELATRDRCAADGHPPCTFNPLHDATWCRCGALVVAGNSAPIPAPRVIVPRGKFDTAADLQRRAERMAERRAERYAAKFRADTVGVGNPLEPTDANLAAVLQTDGIVRKARTDEFPAIREALTAWGSDGVWREPLAPGHRVALCGSRGGYTGTVVEATPAEDAKRLPLPLPTVVVQWDDGIRLPEYREDLERL